MSINRTAHVLRSVASREETTDVLDLGEAAVFLKTTKRGVRGRVSRRQIPYRKLGRRLMFLRSELRCFVSELPGCSYAEARKNMERDPEMS